MPACDRVSDLFPDDPEDWRDPGDDVERAANLIVVVVGALAGLAFIIGSTITAAHARHGAGGGVFLFGTLFGLFLLVSCSLFLFREARRVDWRAMTADRFVAGGITAGLGMSGIGTMMLRAASTGARGEGAAKLIVLFGATSLGALMIVFWLFVGLACAFAGGRLTTRTIPVRRVLSRYAVEPTGECAFEHPNPAEDGVQGWISFRGMDGRKYDFRACPAAYAIAYDAPGGDVRIERGTIVAIHPARRVFSGGR